jgi:hypothetical protein
LIRQHQLDPTLVKRYAADFCGTQELREASRDLVESFITHIAEWRPRIVLACFASSTAMRKRSRRGHETTIPRPAFGIEEW